MSLTAILDAIRAQGESQVDEIEAEARTKSYEILANAGMEAEEEKEKVRLATIAPAVRKRARIIHRARLESLQNLGNIRESLVDAALDQTRGRLAGIRRDANYLKILRSLTQDAIKELDGSLEGAGEIQLQVDPRDRPIMEHILEDIDLDLMVEYDLNCWGGIVAKSQDGRVVVINTLEARLERATPYLRRFLANLFENVDQDLGEFGIIEEKVLA